MKVGTHFTSVAETEMAGLAERLLAQYASHRLFLLQGEVGAGKTTLVKHCCRALGVHDDLSSPTYSLVNEYQGRQRVVYHADLYRLESLEEALGIGIEEYLHSGSYCFVEWPELILPLLSGNFVTLTLQREETATRKIAVRVS